MVKETKESHKEGKYIEVNGLKMYYEEYGSGYPLILIHGGIATIRVMGWSKQIPFFAKYFKVIAPDSRGHGRTNNPSDKFSYKLMADDMIALIDALKLKKPLVCGWSDGGQIAIEMALNYPEKIKAIVAGGVMTYVTDEMVKVMKNFGVDGPGKINIKYLEKNMPDFVKLMRDSHKHVYGNDYWKKLLENISKMWLDSKEFPGEKIKKIKTPTLILLGDRDENIPLNIAAEMYKLIPDAELAILPNATHSLCETNCEHFNQIVLEFLQRQIA
ncbi:MAG: alpha/beta hydrolase [Asgard group archaeon]|nr:alpha/beta hydrolase [Asgard group archaeon]